MSFVAAAMSGEASRDQMKETLRAFLEWMRAADPKGQTDEVFADVLKAAAAALLACSMLGTGCQACQSGSVLSAEQLVGTSIEVGVWLGTRHRILCCVARTTSSPTVILVRSEL